MFSVADAVTAANQSSSSLSQLESISNHRMFRHLKVTSLLLRSISYPSLIASIPESAFMNRCQNDDDIEQKFLGVELAGVDI